MGKSFNVLVFLLIYWPINIIAQTNFSTEKLIPKDSLLADLQTIKSILLEGHAGLYNYSSEDIIQSAFNEAEKSLSADLTEREFTRVLAQMIGQIECGHTFVRLSAAALKERKRRVGVFPLKVIFIEGKAYVFHNYSPDTSIKKGMEITEVNEQRISDIIKDILPLIPADGGNEGWKLYQFGKNFDYYYRLQYGNVNNYTMRLSDGVSHRLYSIEPMNSDTLNKIKLARYGAEINLSPLYFSILKNSGTGYLRVKSFSNEECARYKQSFGSYLKKSFKQLKKGGCKNLILDLRGNVGGSTDNVIELAKYLKGSTFKSYRAITLSKNTPLSFVNYDKKLRKFTYDNTTTRDGTVFWDNKLCTKTFKPKKKGFKGNLLILIDGSVFSGGSHLCSLIDGRAKTLFIGQKTGGGAKFSNAGIMTTVTLKWSKVRLSVPMFKGEYETKSPNKLAVFPNKKIVPTQTGLMSDRDELIDFTFELIRPLD